MEAIALVQAALHAWEENDRHLMRRYVAAEFVAHNFYPMPLHLESFLMLLAQFHQAFPDWSFNATSFMHTDDMVTTITQQSGTHLGAYSPLLPDRPGIPATGRSFKLLPRKLEFRLHAEKIVTVTAEGSSRAYGLALFQQLGVALPQEVTGDITQPMQA